MIRVGVLRGGTGAHCGASLSCGAHLLRALPRDEFAPVDIYVDAAGVWHVAGRPVIPTDLRGKIDAVWNMLHDVYDVTTHMKLAEQLNALGLPRVGTQPNALKAAFDKHLAKDLLAEAGVRTPRGLYIEAWGDGDREETVSRITAQVAHDFSPPWIVSPIITTSEFISRRAKTRHELFDILLEAFDRSIPVLIEEEVLGKKASVVTIPGFRGQKLYTFLPSGHVPGRDKDSSKELQHVAHRVHTKLALGHYSRIEAVVNRKGHVYVTHVETIPSLAPESDLHGALQAVGATFAELARHFIQSAGTVRT